MDGSARTDAWMFYNVRTVERARALTAVRDAAMIAVPTKFGVITVLIKMVL